MKSKRFELVTLFVFASWGLIRGGSEGLGFLLFPGTASTSPWMPYLSRVYLAYGLSGLGLGLSTWIALRWLDFQFTRRTAAFLVGGFLAAWWAGLSLVCFILDPDAGWAWNIGFTLIGALCGLVVALILRQSVLGLSWQLYAVVLLFAAIFLITAQFSSQTLSTLSRFRTIQPSVELIVTVQVGLCGMLSILVILFASKKVKWIFIGWRDFGFALLAFAAGDALSLLATIALGSSPLTPWISNAILAAGWGSGIALAAHRPRSIPYYIFLLMSGITLGRICWLGTSTSSGYIYYQSVFVFELFFSGMIGLFAAVGVRRLITVLLMVATAILAFWFGNLVPFPYPDYSLGRWVTDIAIAAFQGTVLVWGMVFWGVLSGHSSSAS